MADYLYIHVPFCDSICSYCDFERCKSHPVLRKKWLDAMLSEIKERKETRFKTIYIGGGTPTSLSCEELEILLKELQRFHPVEWSVEANIENLSTEKIHLLKKQGVNRISLGVQTFQDDLLKKIHRLHSKEMIHEKIKEIHDAGIDNISADLIYGLPGQTLEMWMQDLSEIVEDPYVTHLSIYSLTIEENSEFGRNHVVKAEDELEESMYFTAIDYLEEKGFHQYEISNFARRQLRSMHNCAYWKYEDFVGLGCGAYGKEDHVYYHHVFRLDTYLKGEDVCEKTALSLQDERFESIMMGLRMKEGVDLDDWGKRFSGNLQEIYQYAIQKHIDLNHLEICDNHLRCTQKGWGLLNDILIDFME